MPLQEDINPEVQENSYSPQVPFQEPDPLDSIAPQAIKIDQEKKDDIVGIVTGNYNTFVTSEWFTKRKKDWETWHKSYLSVLDPSSFPWTNASNCDLGVIEMCVDNIKSRYKLSTIGAKPMFNCIPMSQSGEDKKQQVTDSMNYILDVDIDIDKRIDIISQNTVEYGTCITKLYWKRDIKITKSWNKVEEIVFPVEKTETEEGGWLDVIDLVDIVVPEGAGPDIHALPWIYHRVWYSLYDLQKKVKLGLFSQESVDVIKSAIQNQKIQGLKTAEEIEKKINKLPEEKVEVLECYMRYDCKNEGLEEECVFWICPTTSTYLKGFYLKDLYFNGRRPFYRFPYKETGSFYARGVPEMIMPYRTIINNLFNFSINCLMLQILPWGFYRIGSSFKPEEVRLAPGVMIPVDDINDVRIAEFPPTAQVVEGVVMLIMSFIERQTGISAPQMGKEFPTRKTATEVKSILSEGNVKHEDRIQVFQDHFSDLLKGIYNLYRQNQSNPDREGSLRSGEDYKFVKLFSAFDQMPDFDFVILGTLATGNKAMEREDTMGLYSITSQNPLMANWWPGQLESLKDLYATFGKRNLSRFLPPDQLVKQMGDLHIQGLVRQLMGAAGGQQPAAPGQTPQEPMDQPQPEGASQPSTGLPMGGSVGGEVPQQ
jgi:hypothetical protein